MADVKFTSVPSKRLSESIVASDSTLKLNNIKGWDDVDLVAGDFGSLLYAVLRNDANTIMELIELDPATIALSSITINKRGLKFTGDLSTQVTANKKTWVKNETIVELGSNPPQLLNHIVRTIGAQTIAGIKTFTDLPAISAGDPVADNDIARKAYVDSVVAGSFPSDRLAIAATAGETVADGELVYFDLTDNEWKLCDADTAATVDNVLLGIAQGAGTNGNAITGGVLLYGIDNAQSGMTQGDVMFAGNTAGAIVFSAGTTEVTIGIARSATDLFFFPRFNQQITEDIQDALAGTSGTPSGSNKYVTDDDVAENTASKVVRATAGGKINTGLLSANLAEADTFFGATDISAAEAETLTDGSNADSLHTHPVHDLGAWATAVADTSTQVGTDSFIVGFHVVTSGSDLVIKTDGSNPPTTIRIKIDDFSNLNTIPFCVPIKSGDYYLIEQVGGNAPSGTTAYIIPINNT